MPTQLLGKKHRLTYKVTKVTVNEDDSVDDYRENHSAKDINEVLADIKDKANWTFDFEFDEKKAQLKRAKSVSWPNVDGRTGHDHPGGAWKYHIDRTKKSEDRLILDDWKATIKNFENKGIVNKKLGLTELEADIEVTVDAKALVDTHSRPKGK
jgi:hypothetical protein